MTTFTGDILILELQENGLFDVEFVNGQIAMTNGLETASILATFGEDYFGNDLTNDEDEKMKSEFPGIIRRNVVTDKTKNDGTAAIIKANQFMINKKIAKSINVTGEITNAFTIIWTVETVSLTDETSKYFINWSQGSLTIGLAD